MVEGLQTSIIVVLAFTVANTLIGTAITIAGAWGLLETTTLLYYGRRLSESVSHIAMDVTFISPIVFGMLTLIPIILLTVALHSKGKRFKSVMMAFISILLIFVLVEFPLALYGIGAMVSETPTALLNGLLASLNRDYVGLPKSVSQTSDISLLWDKLMISNKCCALGGTQDFMVSYGTYAGAWVAPGNRAYTLNNGSSYDDGEIVLPISCCRMVNPETLMANSHWIEAQRYLLSEPCPLDGLYVNTGDAGCYSIILDYLAIYTYAILGSLLGLALIQVGAFAAALYTLLNPEAGRFFGSSVEPAKTKPVGQDAKGKPTALNNAPVDDNPAYGNPHTEYAKPFGEYDYGARQPPVMRIRY